jgi:predicted O-linked N-acetylglucosamine transferase (SPINDLY family)
MQRQAIHRQKPSLPAELVEKQQWDKLERVCRIGAQHSAADPYYSYLLGIALIGKRKPFAAVRAFRHAVELAPDVFHYVQALGTAAMLAGAVEIAVSALQRALDMSPADLGTRQSLAHSLSLRARGRVRSGLFTAAAEDFLRAADVAGRHEQLLNEAGGALLWSGETRKAASVFAEAVHLGNYDQPRSNYLLTLNYLHGLGNETIYHEHLRVAPLPAHRHGRIRSALKRPIRVGFVSGDFNWHPVGRFVEPLIDGVDQTDVTFILFSSSQSGDSLTDRLRRRARVVAIGGDDDDTASNLISKEDIDVLIDLSGHTRGNRLGIFARRPAPISATYLGYPNTTGMKAIDFRITDRFTDPPGDADRYYSEMLVRLPGPLVCFRPPRDTVNSPILSRLETSAITLGSFNQLAKISDGTIELWAAALNVIPKSRLLLKAQGASDPLARRRIRMAFAAHGVSHNRVRFLNSASDHLDHLDAYQLIDIALDTFPYNGTMTTCEALSEGVPVVTLLGSNHRSRVGGMLLQAAGFSEWVARSASEFPTVVSELARDRRALQGIRRELPHLVRRSSLCDELAFTTGFQQTLHEMGARASPTH